MKSKICLWIALLLILVIPINALDETFYVNEAEQIHIGIDAFDPDKEDLLSYYFSPPLNENGSWATGYDDSGEYVIELSVYDGKEYDKTNITIIVVDMDRAPIIIATGPRFVRENEEIVVEIDAFDPDGDTINFEAIDIPNGSSFESGVFTWTPDYEVVQKSWFVKILNHYWIDWLKTQKKIEVNIFAKGKDLGSHGTIPIIVTDVNRAPVIDELDDIFIEETETLYLNVSAIDPDEDYIRYFFLGWSNKQKKKTSYEDEGEYNVTILASDGLLSDSTTVNIFVENRNRYPSLEDIKEVNIKENQTLNIFINGSDGDNDDLEFMVSDLNLMPSGSKFENNTFTWKPGFNTISSEDKTKEFNINFTAWDGENSDTKNAKITVHNVNRAPILTNYSPEEIRQVIWIGEDLTFSINATDLDEDNITYKWNFGIFDRNINSPIIKRVFRRAGIKKITAIASDGKKEITQSWLVRVKPAVKVKSVKVEEEKERNYGEFYHFVIQYEENLEEEGLSQEDYEFLIN